MNRHAVTIAQTARNVATTALRRSKAYLTDDERIDEPNGNQFRNQKARADHYAAYAHGMDLALEWLANPHNGWTWLKDPDGAWWVYIPDPDDPAEVAAEFHFSPGSHVFTIAADTGLIKP